MRYDKPLSISLAQAVLAGQKLRANETVSVTTFRLVYAAKRATA